MAEKPDKLNEITRSKLRAHLIGKRDGIQVTSSAVHLSSTRGHLTAN